VSEAETAAAELAERTGVERHDVAIVLGSGWVPAIDVLGEPAAEFPVTELSGFLPPAVEGHAGRVRSVGSDIGEVASDHFPVRIDIDLETPFGLGGR